MTKRLLSFLLALVLLCTMLPRIELKAKAANMPPYKEALIDFDMNKIKQVGTQSFSGPCGAYALAYCTTILENKVHYYTEYYSNGIAIWANGKYINHGGNYKSTEIAAFQDLYDRVVAGNPTIVKVMEGRSTGQHYIAVVGVTNVTSYENLTASNFLILDPALGSASQLKVENMGAAGGGYKLKPGSSGYQVVCNGTGKTATVTTVENETLSFDFNTNGGSFPAAVYSATVNGINISRPGEGLVVYDQVGTQPGTNIYGNEIAVNANGAITAVRRYGDENKLTVPSGGFILSGQSGWDAENHVNIGGGVTVGKIADMGNAYVSFDYETGVVKAFDSYTGYLAETKRVRENAAYGVLPVPMRDGYVFEGWVGQNGEKITYQSILNSTYLTASWSREDELQPKATLEYNGHYYELYDSNVTWTKAKNLCEAMGGHLVTITSAAEQNAIVGLLSQGSRGLYRIGATDIDGTWKWITGESFSYTNWDLSAPEPTNGDQEYYSCIMAKDNPPNKQVGEWVDDMDTTYGSFYDLSNTGFICEYDRPERQYIVSFENTGDTYFDDITVTPGQAVTLPDTVPTRFGDNFQGWEYNGTTYQPGQTITPQGNMTLRATWSCRDFTLGAYNPMSSWISYLGVGNYTMLRVTESKEYIFYGTNDDSIDCLIVLYDANGSMIAKDDDSGGNDQFKLTAYLETGRTYYIYVAAWGSSFVNKNIFYVVEDNENVENERYTVSFSFTGTSWGGNDIVVEPGQSATIPSTIPVWYGMNFLGWDFLGTTYLPGQTITPGCDITFTGLWEEWPEVQYEVGYVYNVVSDIVCPGDEYCTQVIIPEDGTYTFIGVNDDDIDCLIKLWDSDMVLVGENDDGGGARQFKLTKYLEAGTYYAYVRHWNALNNGPIHWQLFREEEVPAITGISVESLPNRTEFLIGEPLNTNGLVLRVNYSDGSYEMVRSGYIYSGYDSTIVGTQQITITYQDFTTSYDITVRDYGTTGDVNWHMDGTTLVISGNGYMEDYEGTLSSRAPWCYNQERIQRIVIQNGVKSIGNHTFRDLKNVTSVTIPNSITRIGDHAFYSCYSLTSVTIPGSVTSIGNYAFCCCSDLSSVTIPDSVTSIGCDAFCYCESLTSITIPDSVTSLEYSVFFYCDNLTNITIPDSVTSIGQYAFSYCTSLTDVYYGGTQQQWNQITIDSFNEYLTNATIHFAEVNQPEITGISINTLPDRTEYVVGESLSIMGLTLRVDYSNGSHEIITRGYDTSDFDCTAAGTQRITVTFQGFTTSFNVIVHDYGMAGDVKWRIEGTTLKLFGSGYMADYGPQVYAPWKTELDRITSVSIADGIKSIGADAFSELCLKSVTIPDSVTSIGNRAFSNCGDLQRVTIGKGVTSIGRLAFYNCSNLTDVYYNGRRDQWNQITIGEANDQLINATLHTVEPVRITKQPVSVTVAEGKSATVSFTATGDGLTYKWYYKNKGASGFALTTTFTGNTYTAEMNADRNGRQIYCVVTDQYGNTVQTETVTISMQNKAKITKQPASVTVASGKTATVSFTATGDGLTYQWYYKNKGASTFTLTTTFTGNTYSAEMNADRNGRQIYCVVTDQYGNKVQTNTVTIGMQSKAKITKQPVSVTVASGKTATVSFTATGDGLTYKWYYKNKGASTFTLTTTFTGNTYTAEMNADRNGRQIYCVVTDQYGNTVQTETVTISMQNKAKITKQPVSVAVANGKTATVSFTATGDGLTYKWYYKNKGASTFTLTTTFTGNTYTAEMNADRNGRQIYCVVTDKYGNSVGTDTVTLSMQNKATITKQPTSVTVASGKTATVSFNATGDGLTYKWYYKNKGASTFTLTTTFTGNTYTAEMNADRNGRQIYCVITDKYGNKVQTNTVTLNMTK